MESLAAVISKLLAMEALDATSPILWVWLSYNNAHIFTDADTDIVKSTIRTISIVMNQCIIIWKQGKYMLKSIADTRIAGG